MTETERLAEIGRLVQEQEADDKSSYPRFRSRRGREISANPFTMAQNTPGTSFHVDKRDAVALGLEYGDYHGWAECDV